ncbi:pilus assembly protein, partial [Streptomyces sp. NPDC127044]
RGGAGRAAGGAGVRGCLTRHTPPPAQGSDVTTATVTVTVPGVIPFFGPYPVTRHATMPTDN